MDEKPKKNPKYESVKGRLDTGPTVKKVVVLSKTGSDYRRQQRGEEEK